MLALVQWVSIFPEITSEKDVRAALDAVGITVFDPDKWPNIVEAIDVYVDGKVEGATAWSQVGRSGRGLGAI
jgi:hypothetical protein